MNEPKYSFLSWVRQGLSKYAKTPDNDAERSSISVEITVADQMVQQNVQIYGPGDITAIDPRNIIRVHPEPNVGNFESNYLPFIEFYQDSFLWDYTPTSNDNNRLDPWLFLLVLEEGEYDKPEVSEGLGKINLVVQDVFPPDGQRWAWGHVHVNADVNSIDSLQDKLTSNPDYAVCRLMSPRKLSPNKRYEAFVIPAYEVGRLTGLGENIESITGLNVLKSSWFIEATTIRPLTFPYYYSWSFSTGAEGDFESLVRALKPEVNLDESIGYRPIDVTEAKLDGLVGAPKNEDGTPMEQVMLGGALKPVGSSYQAFTDESWQKEMVDLLNMREGIQKDNYENDATNEDPIIVPPTYGHWHVTVSQLNNGNESAEGEAIDTSESIWLHQLSLDPKHRAAAGVGTKIIQENQDQYLATAWKQIGAVLEANQLIKNSQLGIEIAVKWWEKHVISQPESEIINTTAPLLDQLICKQQTIPNIQNNIDNSSTPSAAFSPIIRRLSNNRGRFVKKFNRRKKTNQKIHKYISNGIIDNLILLPVKTTPTDKNNVIYQGKNPIFPCTVRNVVYKPEMLTLPVIYFPGRPSDGGKPKRKIINPNLPNQPNNPNNPSQGQQLDINEKDFVSAWQIFVKVLDCKTNDSQPKPIDLSGIIACTKNGLNPAETIKGRTISKIGADIDEIIPIMAAPDYPEPMYKKLLEQSSDFILPNLDKLPNNSISLMEVNQKFIEAFMVGLNYEMAGELLWNEYPTDQRGSYFRQFWDVSKFINVNGNSDEFIAEKLKDIDSIHRWGKNTFIGDHRNSTRNLPHEAPISIPTNPLVLTIRGDLLTRYPEAIIYAAKAKADGSFDTVQNLTDIKYPIFTAKIEPDITFLGFDLTESEVRGNGVNDHGYYFCIKEPNTGPRFGMDVDNTDDIAPSPPSSWNDLHWGHVMTNNYIDLNNMTFSSSLKCDELTWGSDAATMASILYQVPVLVAIHGRHLLPNP